MVSDIVLGGALPEKARSSMALWASCVSGAILEKDYLGLMKEAGFEEISVVGRKSAGDLISPDQADALRSQVPDLSRTESERVAGLIQSVSVKALKRR